MTTLTINDDASEVAVAKAVLSLDPDKRPWLIRIEREREKRTLDQNALFHWWADLLADHTGHTKEEIKAYLKELFLPIKVITIANRAQLIHKPTSDLDVAEMGQFLDKIQAWAWTDLDFTLPNRQDRQAS